MKTYKKKLVAFTAPSNEGKTSLIINLSKILQIKKFKIAIVKHDPCDKAVFDTKGKDSYNFSQLGVDVVVTSPTRTTMFKQNNQSIEEISKLFGDFDYMFVEGLKSIPLPRLCVCRTKIHYDYFDKSDVLLIDKKLKNVATHNMQTIQLDDYEKIIQWIDKYALKL